MHELSVCRGLVRQLGVLAAAHCASRIETVYLRIGPLSGIEITLLESAFPIATRNTVAEHAQLVIRRTALQVECPVCHETSEASPADLRCRHCGEWRTRLVSGDEMLLEAVDLDTPFEDKEHTHV